MTLGLEWNEEISYDDPRNGQTAMDRAADPTAMCWGCR